MKFFKIPIKIKILLGLFVVGFFIGIVTANQSNVTMPILEYDSVSKIKFFINLVTLNFWDLFIVWCLGYNLIGILLILLISFLKGYIEGNSLMWLLDFLPNLTTVNIVSFILYWLIIIPLFFWLANSVIIRERIFDEQKNKTILIVLIIDVMYSLILTLIN